jgi:hypothetical protein
MVTKILSGIYSFVKYGVLEGRKYARSLQKGFNKLVLII